MAESLHCSPRTITTLLTAILKYKIKSLKNRIYEKLFGAAQTLLDSLGVGCQANCQMCEMFSLSHWFSVASFHASLPCLLNVLSLPLLPAFIQGWILWASFLAPFSHPFYTFAFSHITQFHDFNPYLHTDDLKKYVISSPYLFSMLQTFILTSSKMV